MPKKIVGVIIFLLLIISAFAALPTRLIKVKISNHSEVYKFSRYTITDAGKDFVTILATDSDIEKIRSQGYSVETLIEDYYAYKRNIHARGFYHTYAQTYAVLDSFARNYPTICHLDTIGFSVQGRAIWAMKVKNSPTVEEYKPEIRLAGNIHGDEQIGTEITLYFLRYLLTNYASNSWVQNLVNNREIWIIPILNPDGHVADVRENANGIDLNRDYGYMWSGEGSSPGPSSQIENQAMMQHALDNNITIEYNYHSNASYVNYLWDHHFADPPDSQYIITISQVYADSSGLTPINGYDWYQVTGSLQDYTFGTGGGIATTIETDEPAGSSAIDQICYNNRDALLDICNRADWGIYGVVRDSTTNNPLYVRVEIVSPERVCVYTDPTVGDFHKMMQSGTYSIRLSANGYQPKTVNNIVVPATGNINLGSILLVPNTGWRYAFRVILARYSSHAEESNKTQPRYSLGAVDNVFFSLGQSGYIVLDMGTPITNNSGNDFTVYEGNDGTNEGYVVYASNSWTGPWSSCGSDTGTGSFDLSAAGLSQARYIRIVDDGNATSGQYAGFDLDAIMAAPPVNAPNLFITGSQVLGGNGNGILDPGETANLVITLHNSGLLAANNTNGKLKSADPYIMITDSLGYYGGIMPDSEKTNNADPFTVYALPSTPVGHVAHFNLIVTATSYIDTLGLDLNVGRPMPTDTGYYYTYWSHGPYQQAPVYSWYAIDTTQSAHPGTSLGLTDDQTSTVSVPFTFRYYGVTYTQAAVCSNGWLALGTETSTNWTNVGLPSASAPAKAVFGVWDDLDPGSGAADVYYYNDAVNHRFVVEWFRVPHIGTNLLENFEIMLYDPAFTPTPTGDGEIIVQYRNAMQQADNTVGIQNSVRTVGIQYYYDGTYNTLGVPITDTFALKFTPVAPTVGVVEENNNNSLTNHQILTVFPSVTRSRVQIAYNTGVRAERLGLRIYDISGRLVKTFALGPPSSAEVVWMGDDNAGQPVSPGVYFIHLKYGDREAISKIILIK
jgi:hypothetical protein